MISAIFSLVGVIVGGLLTGSLQTLQQRRTERAEARTAARLLSAELSEAHLFLDALVKRNSADTVAPNTPAVAAWSEYRAVMARLLDDEKWIAVARAYVELSQFDAERALDPQALDELVQDARLQLQQVWRDN